MCLFFPLSLYLDLRDTCPLETAGERLSGSGTDSRDVGETTMNALLPPFVSSERADTAEVFTELLYRIRKGRYQLSAEEAKALKKCENDLQVCGVLGALLLYFVQYSWSTRT